MGTLLGTIISDDYDVHYSVISKDTSSMQCESRDDGETRIRMRMRTETKFRIRTRMRLRVLTMPVKIKYMVSQQ